MAPPEQTRRQFGPEATARRAHKAEREARFREVAADMMDIGRGAPRVRDSVEAAVDEALGTSAERVAVRMARDPRAMQAAQRALSARKVELRSGEQRSAEQAQRRRPSPRDWLESMTPEQRRNIETTDYFKQQGSEVRARILRLRDDVDELDAEADELLEYERAQHVEDAWLASHEDEGAEEDEREGQFEERRADALERESAAAFGTWTDETLTVEQAYGLEIAEDEPGLSEEVGWEEGGE